MVDHKVKGSHVIQAQRWIDARLGEGAYKRFAGGQSASHAGLLLPGQWYELQPLIQALQTASQQSGAAMYDMMTEIAMKNAQEDLPTIYKVFVRVLSPLRLLSQTPQLWSTYVGFARAQALTNTRGHYIGRCSGVPEHFLPWAEGGWNGFLPAAVIMTGGKNPRGKVLDETRDAEGGTLTFRYEMHYE